jgi:hypothetical protein
VSRAAADSICQAMIVYTLIRSQVAVGRDKQQSENDGDLPSGAGAWGEHVVVELCGQCERLGLLARRVCALQPTGVRKDLLRIPQPSTINDHHWRDQSIETAVEGRYSRER